MAWVETSKYRPVERGWYWVELPYAEEAALAEWKYDALDQRDAWWIGGFRTSAHSLAYPIRYWDKPIRRRKLPQHKVQKVALAELREEPTP